MFNKRNHLARTIITPSYLKSLCPYFLGASVIFTVGIIIGYYFAELYPSRAQDFISLLEKIYGPILEQNKFSQVLFIFLKNAVSSFLIIILGIVFGIAPLIALINNGEILGMLANIIFKSHSVSYFFAGILPHGAIEIPCFLISSAIGLRVGRTLIKKIERQNVSIIKELNLGLRVFLLIMIFLFLAALVEALVTPGLLRIY